MKKITLIIMLVLLFAPGMAGAIYDPDAPIPEGDGLTPTLMLAKLDASPAATYLDPVTKVEMPIGSAYDAFRIMQDHGLGISQASYDKFNAAAPAHLDGRILLNVEDMGKAYLVDAANDKLIYLGKPDNALIEFGRYHDVSESATEQDICLANDGNWLSEQNECENVGKDWCEGNGGEFNECASACRHNSDPLAPCTLQCVLVCEFTDDSEVSIFNKTWTWTQTSMNNDETTVPADKDAFTLTLKEDGRFNGTSDCNNFFGSADINGGKMTFGAIGSTKMFCEGSQESAFTGSLGEVESYLIDENGRLVLQIKLDSGSITLK